LALANLADDFGDAASMTLLLAGQLSSTER